MTTAFASTLYKLTDEHRAQLGPWAERWIANALSTAPTTPEDVGRIKDHVTGLYEAAKLPPPPRHRIVVVPSPFVLRYAGGLAAAWWWVAKQDKKKKYQIQVPDWSLGEQAPEATIRATWRATRAAISGDPIDFPILREDESQGTYHPETGCASTWYATAPLRPTAEAMLGTEWAELGMGCAYHSYRMWQGGNQWSGYAAYLSFFRHIAKLPLDYSGWQHYEALAELSGPRVMHTNYCLVSERPTTLVTEKVEAVYRPHNDRGPFCVWRDGTALYAWHGTYVPQRIIEAPETITADDITKEANASIRRVMVTKYGPQRYIQSLGVKPISVVETVRGPEELYRVPRPGDSDLCLARVINGTPEPLGSTPDGDHWVNGARWWRRDWVRVPPDHATRVEQAVAWTYGVPEEDFDINAPRT